MIASRAAIAASGVGVGDGSVHRAKVSAPLRPNLSVTWRRPHPALGISAVATWQGSCFAPEGVKATTEIVLAELCAMRCHAPQIRARRVVGGGGVAAARDRVGAPMAINEMLSFLGMCAVAAGVYRLACWVGCFF